MRSPRRPDPEAFAERMAERRALAADASSLIVLAEIGVLEAVRRRWRLATIRAVAQEAGEPAQGVDLLEEAAQGAPAASRGAGLADAALVAAAQRHRLPLLSEDRKVLMAAEEARLDCLDSLVVLELLAAWDLLDPEACAAARRALLSRSDIRPYRLAWAREAGQAALKIR